MLSSWHFWLVWIGRRSAQRRSGDRAPRAQRGMYQRDARRESRLTVGQPVRAGVGTTGIFIICQHLPTHLVEGIIDIDPIHELQTAIGLHDVCLPHPLAPLISECVGKDAADG